MDANSGTTEAITQTMLDDTKMLTTKPIFSTSTTQVESQDASCTDLPQRPFPSAFGSRSFSSSVPEYVHPQSILIRSEPAIQVTITVPEMPSGASTGPEESPSVTEAPRLTVSGSNAMNSRASSLSSESSSSSALSSMTSSSVCTRMTATSATTAPLCISFAPLPSLEPRVRKSKRPLGIAARGQILRQRKLAMEAQQDGYYDNSDEDLRVSIPGSGRRSSNSAQEEVIVEDPFISLGRALNDATKIIWRRISSSKPRSGSADGQLPQYAGRKRGFSLRIRRRVNSTGSMAPDASDSDDDSDDEHWRRRNEDPMTKTIMEGEEHEFILGYDDEAEEEDVELTRAHDEIRSTIELHVVESDDSTASA